MFKSHPAIAFNRRFPSRSLLGLLAVAVWLAWPAATAAGGAEAPQQNPHIWQTRTTSVSVFKNGLGFFLREGDVALRDGWCLAGQIPPAAFGTLAVYSLQDGELVDVVGSGPGEIVDFDGLDLPADIATKTGRLNAAKHLNVRLTYRQHGADRAATGRLVSVGEEYVVLESDSNSFAVPLDGIVRLEVLDLPLRVHVTGEREQPQQTRLGMAYLRKGIIWIPEYSLKVLDDSTAELTLRGTLINEAEDLVHCDVNFVVGVPHFMHTDYMAPVAVGQVIRTIGTATAPEQVRTQIMNRAALITNNAATFDPNDPQAGVIEQPLANAGGDLGSVLGNLPQIDSHGGSDYTVYTKKDLTIRMGEKAIVTLFKKKISYSHVYRWNLPETMQHFLVLHNDTDTAWTTGPCLAVAGDQPLSEDLLNYTPRQGRGELPVTSAINIAHERTEKESDRKLKAHSPQDHVYFDLVTVSGELRLKNYEAQPADVLIAATVLGKPTEASDDGQLTTDSTQLRLLERAGAVRWKIQLAPGESKIVRYAYERYVPSN